MEMGLAIVDVGPSLVTYGALLLAVLLISLLAVFLGRRPLRWTGGSVLNRSGKLAALTFTALGLVAATSVAYVLFVGLAIPGACTFFAGPSLPALSVPPLVLVAASLWDRFGRRGRWAACATLVGVFWAGSVEAASVLAYDRGCATASERYGIRPRQQVHYDRSEATAPHESLALTREFDKSVHKLRRQTRAEVRALLGPPSDEGNDPETVSKLVGITVDELDAGAFSYMRFLYADGSLAVLLFDACSDRLASFSIRHPDSWLKKQIGGASAAE